MNDISDGLASEITEISNSSKVGMELWEEKLPYSRILLDAAEKFDISPLNLALSGGEDYQLVFTCKREKHKELMKRFTDKFSKELFLIGEVIPKENGVKLVNSMGKSLDLNIKGYSHF